MTSYLSNPHTNPTTQARLPLARRLAPAVEAMCLLPSLPPALREECLAHARTLLLGPGQPQAQAGKKQGNNFG